MSTRVIELIEGEEKTIPRQAISEALASQIYKTRGLELDFPSPANEFSYCLRSPNTIGQIPVGADLIIRIAPKVPVANVFRMLEVAYDLPSFRFLEGQVDVASLPDVFERLAGILARRVLDRARRGLYRSYVDQTDDLGYVRGRLDIRETTRLLRTGEVAVRCEFQEHTSDIEDNQILLWTLSVISRLALRRPDVARDVRSARRMLFGAASLQPFRASDCVARAYNRLNEDYQALHGICRFFLDNTGPGSGHGDRDILPFTLNMPALFESYVAKWLSANAPGGLRVAAQHQADLDQEGRLSFRIDLVVFDRFTNQPLAVLDTKYKAHQLPSQEDIQQIVAYAVRMGVTDAYLVYPSRTATPRALEVGPVKVASRIFDLDTNLEVSGAAIWEGLMRDLGRA